MKTTKRVLAVILAAAVLVGLLAVTTLAGDGDPVVAYDYKTNKVTITGADKYFDDHDHQKVNLFIGAENMMPGDSIRQPITLKTSTLAKGNATFYLKIEPNGDNISAEEQAFYEALVDAGYLKISLADGLAAEENAVRDVAPYTSGDGFQIAALGSNQQKDLTIILTLDASTPNEVNGISVQDNVAAVEWVFVVNAVEGGGGGGGRGGGGKSSTPSLVKDDHFAYIIGRDDGLVHPEADITRAEVATIFFRLLTDTSRADFWSQTNDYSDVQSHHWFNNAVSTLSNANILKGYRDGTFRPNASITRAEFAAMAVRFFGGEYSGEDMFSDIMGHWAQQAINQAASMKLVEGYGDGTFCPDQVISRCEAMTIINRVLERAPDKDHLLKNMITWPDNMDTSAWFYAQVQEATNSHNYEFKTKDGVKYEVWLNMKPVRDWAALETEWANANSSENPGNVVKN